MNPADGQVLIAGKSRDAASWRALMASSLATAGTETRSPSLGQSLTRLHYLDSAFLPKDESDELEWLIEEARHHHLQRDSKHRLLKWSPRQARQRQTEHYFQRAAVKSAAYLRIQEEQFLLLRGRRSQTQPVVKNLTPPTWRTFERMEAAFRETAPEVWTSAAIVAELAPNLDYLLGQTEWLETNPALLSEARAGFEHYVWHAREVRLSHPGSSCWRRESRAAQANTLLLISLEKLVSLLFTLRRRLIRWDAGSEDAEIAGA